MSLWKKQTKPSQQYARAAQLLYIRVLVTFFVLYSPDGWADTALMTAVDIWPFFIYKTFMNKVSFYFVRLYTSSIVKSA